MALFSIADLHLSHIANKPMDKFGSRWTAHTEKLEKRWRAVVSDEDTVVVPGDISWGISLDEALPDLQFIDALPGKKLIGKGNHDYWWSTLTKMRGFLSDNGISTMDFLYNNAYDTGEYIVCGTRGWYVEEKLQGAELDADYDKIVARECMRLALCLDAAEALRGDSDKRILVYLHFPPVFKSFVCRELVDVLKERKIKNCYFGHIHGQYNIPRTTEFEGIDFTLIASDFLDFIPMITQPLDY